MQINWFTVAAQVLNFLLLVWLLRRFLYHPILKAIDDREKKIADQIRDAAAKQAEAKEEKEEFSLKNEKFDKAKKDLMTKAVTEVNDERNRLQEEARKEAAALRSKQEKALKEMASHHELQLVKRTQDEVFAIAGKVLGDLSSQSLEEQAVNTFLHRLTTLETAGKKQFEDAFETNASLSKGKQEPMLIRSAFELSRKLQTSITSAVKEVLPGDVSFEFETSPALVSGIELSLHGYKLAWSISAYLASLEQSIAESAKNKSVTTFGTEKDAIQHAK